jgi:hypothetical protein
VLSDLFEETEEVFVVQLSNPVNAVLPPSPQFVVTIAPSASQGANAPPVINSAVPGEKQVTVNFEPSIDLFGVPAVASFKVVAQPGGLVTTAGSTARQVTITGLTNGVAYTFTVIAVNPFGDSLPSAPSIPVTPGTAVVELTLAVALAAANADPALFDAQVKSDLENALPGRFSIALASVLCQSLLALRLLLVYSIKH